MTATSEFEGSLIGLFWNPISNWADDEEELPPMEPYCMPSEPAPGTVRPNVSYLDALLGSPKPVDEVSIPEEPPEVTKIPKEPVHKKKKQYPKPITRPKREDDLSLLDEAVATAQQESPTYSTQLYEKHTEIMPPCMQILNIFIMFYPKTMREHNAVNRSLTSVCSQLLPNDQKSKIERAVLERFVKRTTNQEMWLLIQTVCKLFGKKHEALRSVIVSGEFHMTTYLPKLESK
jgi:hypothetical protein